MTAIGDLASVTAISGVASDRHLPFVQLRATSIDGAVAEEGALDVVLIGQLDPAAARGLALSILEAADASEFDSALVNLMLRRLEGDEHRDAKVAAILKDLRDYREATDAG